MPTTFTPPTPEELIAIRESTNLSTDEFGTMIGYGDPARTIRGLEAGERNGKPYALSGTATAALTYAMALKQIIAACNETGAKTELAKAIGQAAALLPKRMLT